MLSDEEKKAIKILKINPEIIVDLDEEMFEKMCEFKEKSIKELRYWASQIILNLIEKQQKEIEVVKFLYDDACRCLLNTVNKDKIKAKIEELEQIKNTALTERTVEMMHDKINILQLLLEEKE